MGEKAVERGSIDVANGRYDRAAPLCVVDVCERVGIEQYHISELARATFVPSDSVARKRRAGLSIAVRSASSRVSPAS